MPLTINERVELVFIYLVLMALLIDLLRRNLIEFIHNQNCLKCYGVRLTAHPVFYLFPVFVVGGYPTPSEGWGHGGRPWSPRSRATPQGLDQRS